MKNVDVAVSDLVPKEQRALAMVSCCANETLQSEKERRLCRRATSWDSEASLDCGDPASNSLVMENSGIFWHLSAGPGFPR